MSALERRFAALVAGGEPFTADDVTAAGAIAFDDGHGANGKQSAIGTLFNSHARQGHIAFTGQVVRSKAPHRKGGAIREWQPTAAGRRWAFGQIGAAT